MPSKKITKKSARPYRPTNMIGDSPQMLDVYNAIAQVAHSDTTVLIRGESGTGKELVAQAVHDASDRADNPFARVNCASLNESLLESELFGHERGSFTGAIAMRKGRIEEAAGGTLFLDEIGDFSPAIQVKLLRLLQERTYERVGSTVVQNADIRFICATNVDLENAITTGRFREDIYYRINVFPIVIPPLRERMRDIIPLAKFFVEKYSRKMKREGIKISSEAAEMLVGYKWSGNVRELENAIERAVLLCQGNTIQASYLPPRIITDFNKNHAKEITTLAERVAALEEEMIREALKKYTGNQTLAAQSLGTTARILRYKIEQYKIKSGEYKRR
ncbi:MAG: sigma-54 dependent transcriptional regulator [Planctomycetaceae bacterium]|jgi:Nif-specific regulatory protein|nr:sigma-54 dependent transcriptional regulator [Planctomycetaceae bacterium]